MNTITSILLSGSVLIGGIFVEIFKPKKVKNIQLLLTFSGAYLLVISLLHLLPELFKYNVTENIGLYIFGGFLIQIFLEYFSQGIEHGHFHKSNVIPFSILISLCFHALLEGVPLGSKLDTHNTLLYGIVLHKLPVAIVLMTFFLQSNMNKSKAYFLLFIFASMSPLGVYAGSILGSLSLFQDKIMAVVIGTFLHISTTILFESTDSHRFNLTKISAIIIATILAFSTLH